MAGPRVAIIYFSATGVTARLAEALREGAEEAGGVGIPLAVAPELIVAGRFADEAMMRACDGADALAFGSPTYMGGPAAQFKAFADATSERWAEQRWAGKVAAGFTTGACANGDQGHTLAYLVILAAQHGMLWCGLDIPGGMDPSGRNRLGTQLGVSALAKDEAVDASDLATARYLGWRLVQVCAKRTT